MRCDYFEAGRCRSCTELTVPYPRQLDAKVRAVQDLVRTPGLTWLDPVPSRERRFRNKAKMVVGGTVAHPLLGIQAPFAGAGVVNDLRHCPLHEEAVEAALPILADFVRTAALTPYDVPTRRGELKHVLVTASPDGELMVRLVLRSREAEARVRKHLPGLLAALPSLAVVSLNILPAHAAVLEGAQEIVLHGDTLTMRVNDLSLHLRPRSFFQTNTEVAAALYRAATSWLTERAPATLWDLYCGVGGFALHAARALPGLAVEGVEVSAEAIASATRTAQELDLASARFVAGDATNLVPTTGPVPDVVVVNPPRRGIGPDLAAWLEESGVGTVLYSSCNARSLAADLAAMPSLRPVRAQVLDMFPQTAHYEVLTLLER
ncbi:23S rRNA (uracil(747)-C(5))-methyltransferase RlmC [Miniimonas sp. S16]|uniref:23S rRNA (uracil(747)-C(5))-methyltransferase RlmC n=1 Tax=Miniimonas sp. S16 TaxID=2171623 RepID=UPI000D52A425|nr:23S rRNA (uracil(747)-C(5))-methyltransferase RlmC [Miniimonas sp. S16]